MIGRTFERLTVVSFSHRRSNTLLWLCQCQCGAQCLVSGSALRGGNQKSCGCLKRERAVANTRNLRHGHRRGAKGSKEYVAWCSAKAHCFNQRRIDYKRYGGRDITMAPEWINDFPAFFAHIGPAPGPGLGWSIDRINNDGNYEPGNVRWATRSQQRKNQRQRARAEAAADA